MDLYNTAFLVFCFGFFDRYDYRIGSALLGLFSFDLNAHEDLFVPPRRWVTKIQYPSAAAPAPLSKCNNQL